MRAGPSCGSPQLRCPFGTRLCGPWVGGLGYRLAADLELLGTGLLLRERSCLSSVFDVGHVVNWRINLPSGRWDQPNGVLSQHARWQRPPALIRKSPIG
ncbi:hypothetical protein XENOCAPTIV_013499 [Xenoophorus captivus]|uniref:Uncharacterized protein n=1 Tax=Xenoophorus captivus TaxID=1517983 RepID=A0ABV0SF35_9TELE